MQEVEEDCRSKTAHPVGVVNIGVCVCVYRFVFGLPDIIFVVQFQFLWKHYFLSLTKSQIS